MNPPRLLLALAAFAALATFAPPTRAASRDVTFDYRGPVRIPFDLRAGHVWVRGTIGTSDSLWIIVDSGAESSVMDDALARMLKLPVTGGPEARGAGGAQAGGRVAGVTIRLPGVSLYRDSLDTVDLGAIGTRSGRTMNLVLGHELFASCVVRFDYAASVMEVWDAAHPPKLSGVVLPLTFDHGLPYVEGSIALPGRAPLHGRFVIDTGSSVALMLAPDIVERDSLVAAFPRTIETLGRGVGGEVRSRVGRADAFTLGNLRFDRPIVVMPRAGGISTGGALGNIGGPLLGRCRVTFDYARRRVAFEPAENFAAPFETDMSGATIARDATGVSVRLVNPDTPAAEAGLREGDEVTSVDGRPIERLDPAEMRALMQREGRTVRIGVIRDAADTTFTLVLRRIL